MPSNPVRPRLSPGTYPRRVEKKQDRPIDPAQAAFGRRLQRAREAKKKTQDDVGAAFGVGKGTVSAWETGRGDPGIVKLGELARLFEVSPESLLWDSQPVEGVNRVVAELETLRGEKRAEAVELILQLLSVIRTGEDSARAEMGWRKTLGQ
jgi:transcriptional regulator with XRE-family HTH domain